MGLPHERITRHATKAALRFYISFSTHTYTYTFLACSRVFTVPSFTRSTICNGGFGCIHVVVGPVNGRWWMAGLAPTSGHIWARISRGSTYMVVPIQLLGLLNQVLDAFLHLLRHLYQQHNMTFKKRGRISMVDPSATPVCSTHPTSHTPPHHTEHAYTHKTDIHGALDRFASFSQSPRRPPGPSRAPPACLFVPIQQNGFENRSEMESIGGLDGSDGRLMDRSQHARIHLN